MKLDKETLVKQRFWVLLGLEVPLVLIATAILLLGVRSKISAREKALQQTAEAPKKVQGVQNQRCVDKWQEKENEVNQVLTEVWKNAWDQQARLFTWPQDLDEKFNTGLFATKIKVITEEQPVSEQESSYLFRGVVQAVGSDGTTIRVIGKNAQGRPEPRTFDFTPGLTFHDGSADRVIKSFTEWMKPNQKVEVAFLKGKYFGDDFTSNERSTYAKRYNDQFKDLRKFFLNARGELLVQLKGGWAEDNVPDLLRRKKNWDPGRIDDARIPWEIWYAQEDFWIQRELLRAMDRANQFVAHFEPEDNYTDVTIENTPYVFRNPYWKLTLKRKGDQITATLKNVSRKKQRLDIDFLVQLDNDRNKPHKWELKFPGETLNPDKETSPLTQSVDGAKPEGLFGVEQVLTLDTTPVKRLGALALGSHSHRTFPKKLRSFEKEEKQEEPAADANDPKAAARGKSTQGDVKQDDDPRKRYSQTTEQFRRMPVALVFLVDQDSAGYVLTALEESSLRFQVTQVAMTRYPHGLQMEDGKNAQEASRMRDGSQETPKVSPPVQRPRSLYRPGPSSIKRMDPKRAARLIARIRRAQRRPAGGGNVNPLVPVQAPQGEGASLADEQGPVMELTVYGYVTLYERYPAKPEAAALKPQETQSK